MPDQTKYEVSYKAGLLGGVNTILFNASVVQPAADGKTITTITKPIKAIPYFSWNNRGGSEMQVWLPTAVKEVKINP